LSLGLELPKQQQHNHQDADPAVTATLSKTMAHVAMVDDPAAAEDQMAHPLVTVGLTVTVAVMVVPTETKPGMVVPTVVVPPMTAHAIVKTQARRIAATPTVAQATPTVAQATPTVAQATPTVAQATPTVAQATPTVAQATPDVAQATPTVAQAMPDVDRVPRRIPLRAAARLQTRDALVHSDLVHSDLGDHRAPTPGEP
jgi:hypothetical protein